MTDISCNPLPSVLFACLVDAAWRLYQRGGRLCDCHLDHRVQRYGAFLIDPASLLSREIFNLCRILLARVANCPFWPWPAAGAAVAGTTGVILLDLVCVMILCVGAVPDVEIFRPITMFVESLVCGCFALCCSAASGLAAPRFPRAFEPQDPF